MNEKEIEALKKIEFFSRNHGYKLGLAEEKIGVPHYVLDGLNKQKIIFSRTKFGKLYWSLTREGKSIAGKASRGQLVTDIGNDLNSKVSCKHCQLLGIIPTSELLNKAKKMKETMGLLGLTENEFHLITHHSDLK